MLETFDSFIVKFAISVYIGLVASSTIAIWWRMQGKEIATGYRAGWFVIGWVTGGTAIVSIPLTYTLHSLATWLILGAFVGTLIAAWVRIRGQKLHPLSLLTVGLTGALLGLGLYQLVGLDFGLGTVTLSVADLLYSYLGALLLTGLIIYAGKSYPIS